VVEDLVFVNTGLVSERAGDEAFANTGGSGDKDVLSLVNPLTACQSQEDIFIESSALSKINLFNGRFITEFGVVQEA